MPKSKGDKHQGAKKRFGQQAKKERVPWHKEMQIRCKS
jgi:hypothetical protein